MMRGSKLKKLCCEMGKIKKNRLCWWKTSMMKIDKKRLVYIENGKEENGIGWKGIGFDVKEGGVLWEFWECKIGVGRE